MIRERGVQTVTGGLQLSGRRAKPFAFRLVAVFVALSFVSSCSTLKDGKPSGQTVVVRAPNSCQLAGCVGEGIDTAAGAYTVASEDLLFPSGVFGLELVRSYRSDRTASGWFGVGWSTVFETTATSGDSGVTIDAPAGLAPMWHPEVSEGWDVAGAVSVRSGIGGSNELVWPTGEMWKFDQAGLLASMTSPFGQTMLIERINGAPSALRSSQGPTVTFETEAGRVVSASTGDGRSAQFSYEDGHIATASSPGADFSYDYNGDGRMVKLVGPSGTTSVSYSSGDVATQTTASGQRFTLAYDGLTTTVQNTRTLSYKHDESGRLVSVLDGSDELSFRRFDSAGRMIEAVEYSYPGKQLLSQMTREFQGDRLAKETKSGITSEFSYDALGRVTEVAAGGETTSFEYPEDQPLPSAVTTTSDGRDEFVYANGFVTSITDATGVSTATGRDVLGNPISVATGDAGAWKYGFDAEGNVTTTTAPSGRTWSATWGPRSTLLSELDPLGRRTNYRRDAAGRVVALVAADGTLSSYVYDASGHLTQETSPDGLITRYEYDSTGSPSAVLLPGERIWRSSTGLREAGSKVVTVTAPDGSTTESTIDSVGREVGRRSINTDGSIVETSRSTFEFERPIATTVTRGSSVFESLTTYDQLGRVIETADTLDGAVTGSTKYAFEGGRLTGATSDGAQVEYSYDAAGRLLKVRDAGETWEATYLGGQLSATSHNGETTRIGYDIDARANSFTKADNVTTKWTYDDADRSIGRAIGDAAASFSWSASDRLEEYRSPDGSRWTWAYDEAGRITEATEPGGALTTYEYELGSVARVRTTDSENDRDDRFAYDSRGLLLSAKTDAGEFKYVYDATGRPVSVDGSDKEQWGYDALGNVTSVTSGSDVFKIRYDTTGRVESITGQEKSIRATWTADHLSKVEASGRDPLRVTTDEQGRLTDIDWNAETAIELAWSDDGATLDLRQRDGEAAQRYKLEGGYLAAYSSDQTSITGRRQDNGYLESLHLEVDKVVGDIRFDQAGRPAALITDAAASTLIYDSEGRISSALTSRTGKEAALTTVSYDEEGRSIEGDKALIEAIFNKDGGLRTPLPSSLPNPLSAANSEPEQAGGLSGASREVLVSPEPRPIEDTNSLVAAAAPTIATPIGVRDLPKLAEQMVVAEVARLSPSIRINGASETRLPLINPKNGTLADFNPFIDAAPSGLALGQLSSQGGGGNSLLDRAKDTLGDIVGGARSVANSIVEFVIDNPIARLLVSVGSFVAAQVACAATAPVCLPLTALAVFVIAAETLDGLATSAVAALRTCSRGEVVQCGLWVAGGALAIAGGITAVGVGTALAGTYFAKRAYSLAVESGIGVIKASANLGTSKSLLLETLRFRTVVDREVLVCELTCARIDLVTRGAFGTLRGIEVKNGTFARFTSNQNLVYPILKSSGASFPRGLAGLPPHFRTLAVEVQHWGASTRLALP